LAVPARPPMRQQLHPDTSSTTINPANKTYEERITTSQ
jgi:hypothetical protein